MVDTDQDGLRCFNDLVVLDKFMLPSKPDQHVEQKRVIVQSFFTHGVDTGALDLGKDSGVVTWTGALVLLRLEILPLRMCQYMFGDSREFRRRVAYDLG